MDLNQEPVEIDEVSTVEQEGSASVTATKSPVDILPGAMDETPDDILAETVRSPTIPEAEDGDGADTPTAEEDTASVRDSVPATSHSSSPKKSKKGPPRSGYVLFLTEKRRDIVKDSPGLSLADVTRSVAQAWRNMTDSEREKYTNRAASQKAQYAKKNPSKAKRSSGSSKSSQPTTVKRSASESTAGAPAKRKRGRPPKKSESATAAATKAAKSGDSNHKRAEMKENGLKQSSASRVQIFTDEFVEHAKERSRELARLVRQKETLQVANADLAAQTDKFAQLVDNLDRESHAVEVSMKHLKVVWDIITESLAEHADHLPVLLKHGQPLIPTEPDNVVPYFELLLERRPDGDNPEPAIDATTVGTVMKEVIAKIGARAKQHQQLQRQQAVQQQQGPAHGQQQPQQEMATHSSHQHHHHQYHQPQNRPINGRPHLPSQKEASSRQSSSGGDELLMEMTPAAEPLDDSSVPAFSSVGQTNHTQHPEASSNTVGHSAE